MCSPLVRWLTGEFHHDAQAPWHAAVSCLMGHTTEPEHLMPPGAEPHPGLPEKYPCNRVRLMPQLPWCNKTINLMSSAIWALGFWIVEARQKKLLKRLIASPMPRWQYLASFVCWRLLLLPVEVGVFLGFSHFAFGVPTRGSFWQLALLCLLTSLTFSAMGLLIASRAKTMQAASGLMNVTMLPMWILSGVFFSASRFPKVVQPLIRALPLTAAIDALRANMLQGTPLTSVQVPLCILFAWLLVSFSLSLWIFRWR